MRKVKKENFVKPIESSNIASLPSLCGEWLKRPVAHVLVLALAAVSLPAPAHAQKPGIYTKVNVPGVIALSAGVAGGVALWIYLRHHKHKQAKVILETKPVEFPDFAPGKPANLTVPVTNPMNAAIKIEQLSVEDRYGALALGGTHQGSFSLAPGEKYDIPVTLTTNKTGGKARIRIVVTSGESTKEEVKYVSVSYGHPKSGLRKLIP
jgi:hypothetical protein